MFSKHLAVYHCFCVSLTPPLSVFLLGKSGKWNPTSSQSLKSVTRVLNPVSYFDWLRNVIGKVEGQSGPFSIRALHLVI